MTGSPLRQWRKENRFTQKYLAAIAWGADPAFLEGVSTLEDALAAFFAEEDKEEDDSCDVAALEGPID